MIKATNRIAPKIKIEPDGSRMIEMKIGGKEYKILDVNAETHTDDEYGHSKRYAWMKKHEVRVGGMMGDNVDNWENEKLKEYVKEEERKGFHIPKIEEMESLLNELGEEAGIIKERDKIAMLIYLTGMYGFYWLSMGDDKKSDSQANFRSVLGCNDDYPEFDHNGTVYTSATLLMIASS